MGIRCADHATPLYPQKLALTSPTGGGRSVSIVRSRTKATEFSLIINFTIGRFSSPVKVRPQARTLFLKIRCNLTFPIPIWAIQVTAYNVNCTASISLSTVQDKRQTKRHLVYLLYQVLHKLRISSLFIHFSSSVSIPCSDICSLCLPSEQRVAFRNKRWNYFIRNLIQIMNMNYFVVVVHLRDDMCLQNCRR